MSNNTEGREDKMWELSLGFYPGILLGIRTYINHESNEHVLYLPLVDVSLTIYK
jgi:hypothetical protein